MKFYYTLIRRLYDRSLWVVRPKCNNRNVLFKAYKRIVLRDEVMNRYSFTLNMIILDVKEIYLVVKLNRRI